MSTPISGERLLSGQLRQLGKLFQLGKRGYVDAQRGGQIDGVLLLLLLGDDLAEAFAHRVD